MIKKAYNLLIDLKRNANNKEGRINLILHLSALMMLMIHFMLDLFYILTGSMLMFVISIFGTVLYLYFLFNAHKKPVEYGGYSFIAFLIHSVFAVSIYGWSCGFQFWFFAVICSLYLPIYSLKHRMRHSLTVGILFIFVFYTLASVFTGRTYLFQIEVSQLVRAIAYIMNTLITFGAMMSFIFFYTYSTREDEIELRRKADFDQLTNLYNRYAIRAIIENEISKPNNNFSIAIIDLDFFKKINDTYGHNVGDEILIILSKILKKYAKNGINVSRWGGEEFLMVAPSDISYKKFISILEHMRKYIEQTSFKTENNEIKFTVSIGSANYKENIRIEDFIKIADDNLYKAKNSGRNKVIS